MTAATYMDVAVRLGRDPLAVTEEQRLQWQAWLSDTEAMIRRRLPALDALIASGAVQSSAVIAVEASVVVRKVQNPEGLRSMSVAIDDGTITRTRDSASSDGVLRIFDEEWDMITPAASIEAISTPYRYAPGWGHHRAARGRW